jgi:hypothetical protein
MIRVNAKTKAIEIELTKTGKNIQRAMELSIDRTLDEIKDSVWSQLPKFFDRPTPYTLNSLQVTKTQGHNMRGSVWFKWPVRMLQHYLVPQVVGGERKMKGFERALGSYYYPSRHAKLDQYGNVTQGRIWQALSAMSRAEYTSGYAANRTERSARRLKNPKQFFLLKQRRGSLPPGIYEQIRKGKDTRIVPFMIEHRGPRYRRRLQYFIEGFDRFVHSIECS